MGPSNDNRKTNLPLTVALSLSTLALPTFSLARYTLSNATDAAPPPLVSGEVLRVSSPIEAVDVRREPRSFRGPMPSRVTEDWQFTDQHGRTILVPVSLFPTLNTGDVIAVENVLRQDPLFIITSHPGSEILAGKIIRTANPVDISE